MTGLRAAKGLVLACHPLPGLAVTVFATAYAATRHASAATLAGLAAAVLAGQLVVGWTNDAWDAERDTIAARRDKPVPAGLVGARTVAVAAVAAAAACVPLSLRLGLVPGALHLLAIAAAEAYNLRLKNGPASPLPYILSFGLLPVVAAAAVRAADDGAASWPPVSQVLAAALLGAAAHAGNTIGDTTADTATGVRGLPQRLGPDRSLLAMAVLVAAAAIVLLIGIGAAGGWQPLTARVLLVGGALLAATGYLRRTGVGGGQAAFRLTLGAVALIVAGFFVSA